MRQEGLTIILFSSATRHALEDAQRDFYLRNVRTGKTAAQCVVWLETNGASVISNVETWIQVQPGIWLDTSKKNLHAQTTPDFSQDNTQSSPVDL